jgi:hypothetical protein
MATNFCPNCFNELNDNTSVMTEVSSIFTGNNAYVLCKKCNQVLLYNINREMLFDLDDFKDDEKVIAEINELLEKADNHYEVPSPVSKCAESCEQCCGCDTQYKRRSFSDKFFDIPDVFDFPIDNVKQSPIPEEPANEELQKPEPSKNFVDEKVYIAILKFDQSVRHVIHESDLNEFNLKEWDFYEAELHPVDIEPVTTFKITRR